MAPHGMTPGVSPKPFSPPKALRSLELDASRSMPILQASEIPDLAALSDRNRNVAVKPSGMEREEEAEVDLQRAICSGTAIPIPDVIVLEDSTHYGVLYPEDFEIPTKLVHMTLDSDEEESPDYDMDSEDEEWIGSQSDKLDIEINQFEEIMDQLEKGSGQLVVTLQEAKALIKQDDDLVVAVYDYWLNKRLKLQHPLIPEVKTEVRFGITNNHPYLAFRKHAERMKTRKDKKNDEASYEKMLKLKREMDSVLSLFEMIKRRENSKREVVRSSIEVFEKRCQIEGYTGELANDNAALDQHLVGPCPTNTPVDTPNSGIWTKEHLGSMSEKEKTHSEERLCKGSSKPPLNAASGSGNTSFSRIVEPFQEGDGSFGQEKPPFVSRSKANKEEEEGTFAFRPRMGCSYVPPIALESPGKRDNNKFQLCPTFMSKPDGAGGYRNLEYVRRRIGRGGRVILDRSVSGGGDSDDFWRSMGYQVFDSHQRTSGQAPSENITVSSHYSPVPGYGNHHVSTCKTDSSSSKLLPRFQPKSPAKEKSVAGPSELSTFAKGEQDSEESSESETEDESMETEFAGVGGILGTITSPGIKPLVFNIANLLKDPTPHSLHQSPSLGLDTDKV